MQLARSLSFSRRRNKPADVSKTSEENVPVHAAAAVLQPISKLVRSASFGRRRKGPATPKGHPEEESVTREGSESSGSRSDSPDPASSPPSSEPEEPATLSDSLYGWLGKRHASKKDGWGRRYFTVDEARGTLSYSKSNSHKSKSSAVVPLADVTAVTKLDSEGGACQLKISCPPMHLTVRAANEEEQKHWVNQLQLRVDIWRAKAASKYAVANVSEMFAACAKRPAESEAAEGPQHGAGVGVLEPRPAHMSERRKSNGSSEAEPLADGRSPKVCSPCVPRSHSKTPGVARQQLVSERTPTSAYRNADAIDAIETVEILSDEEEDWAQEGPAGAGSVQRNGATRGGAANWASGGFRKTAHSPAAPAPAPRNPAGRPARDLAAMLSSDEDEEIDSVPIATKRVAGASPIGADTTVATVDIPPPRRVLQQPLPPPPAAAPPPAHEPSSFDGWDDEIEQLEQVQIASSARAPPSPQQPQQQVAAPSRVSYREPAPMQYQATYPVEQQAPRLVGDGIVADSNFVEDDWDEEE